MFQIANALFSIRASQQVAGVVIFEDDMPQKALFEDVEVEDRIFEKPYLHFFPADSGIFKVTLAYFDPVNDEYAYPYYTAVASHCTASSDCFLVHSEDPSDVIILNIGSCYQNDRILKEVQDKITELYGDMGL